MKWLTLKLLFLLGTLTVCQGEGYSQTGTALSLKTASHHPMQYLISLPNGWNKNKRWPVILAFEGAEKEYRHNAERFSVARGDLPFIIVAPFIVTNGSQGQRDPSVFPYSEQTWDRVDKEGVCKFDKDGISQIMSDLQNEYSAEDRYFVTGFEAGNHLLWTLVLQHPEQLYAAAPVAGNYIGRCIETALISNHPGREFLPICSFYGQKDELWTRIFRAQDLNARKLAEQHGFKNITERQIHDKGHVPLPQEVISYFAGMYDSRNKN